MWKWSSSGDSPNEWVKSLFGGNGDLGFMIWSDKQNGLRMDVSRTTVYDDRTPDMPEYLNNFVFDQPRLPIGHFELTWSAPIVSATGRLSLHDGIAQLSITTSSGTLGLKVWAQADWETADVMVLETSATGGESWNVTFVPEVARSTWDSSSYVLNPAARVRTSSVGPNLALTMVTQAHLRPTAHSTAVLQDSGSGAVYVTTSPVLASVTAAARPEAFVRIIRTPRPSATPAAPPPPTRFVP